MTSHPGKAITDHYPAFAHKAERLRRARADYLHAFRTDPLAAFFIHRLALSPVRGFLWGMAMVIAIYAFRCGVFLWVVSETAGMQKVLIDFCYDLILVPATYGCYIWISARQSHVTYLLTENGAIAADGPFSNQILHGRLLNRPLIFRIAALTAGILMLLHIPRLSQGGWIWTPHAADYGFLFLLKIPFTWIIPWYMAAVIFLKQVLFVFYIRRRFSHSQVRIDLLHPDRCGGLKPLGDYLLRFTQYLVVCAFGIVLLTIRGIRFRYFHQDYLVQLAILVYIPACLFFFYFPLQPLHLRMQALAAEWRERIREQMTLPKWAFTQAMQTRFTIALVSPILLFVLICIL